MRPAKDYFIPHRGNDYRPHVLRELGIIVIASAIFSVLFVSYIQVAILYHSDLFASVIPSVLVSLANSDRNEQTLPPLTPNAILEKAAQQKANDMAEKGYFAHTSPEGRTPWYWFEKAGYSFSYAGENLAVNFSDSEDVDTAWMNSPGHRANILNSHFTEIGIATARGMYEGRETVFVVQLFGRPSHAAVLQNTPPSIAAAPKAVPLVVGESHTETELFVAARRADESSSSPAKVVAAALSEPSAISQVIASPKKTATYAYLGIGAFVFLSLALAIGIEIRRQHLRHIVYGICLLVLIAGVLWFQQAYIFPIVVIK